MDLKEQKWIDLHMHSRFSDDGEFTPEQLVAQCRDAGIKIMAISDHNSVRANEEGRREAEKAGITYIPAIEIDCSYQGVNLHLLGYGINFQSVDFQAIEKNIEAQEIQASKERLLAVQKLGFPVQASELETLAAGMFCKDIWTGEMFAEVLLNKQELNDHELLMPYRPGGSRSDNPYVNFYWDFFSQGKPCYANVVFPTLESAIETIHKNGGKAVLAHPGNNLAGKFQLFDEMAQLGLDGVEASSSYHSPETTAYFYSKAKELGLFITGGSDYHGKTKPSVKLGTYGRVISEEELEKQIPDFLLVRK